MKNILMILLFLVIYFFSCWIVDRKEEILIMESSGKNYINEQHLLYNKYTFFEDKRQRGGNSEICIKWDRIIGFGSFLGFSYIFVMNSRKKQLNNHYFN